MLVRQGPYPFFPLGTRAGRLSTLSSPASILSLPLARKTSGDFLKYLRKKPLDHGREIPSRLRALAEERLFGHREVTPSARRAL